MAPRKPKPLNRFQAAVAKTYADGDYAWLLDPTEGGQAEACRDDSIGDTLFTFLMRELSDDCQDDLDEAIRRITKSRLDLQEVERVLFALGRTASGENQPDQPAPGPA